MRRAVCFWLVGVTGQLALGQQDPAWTLETAAKIEWIEQIGEGSSAALVVCDEHGRLDLLDARSGARRWKSAVEFEAGVRFAGSLANTLYVYGRNKIYALAVAGDRALRWKAELASAGLRPTDIDPEFQIRTIAAQATASGVLVVRSDGAIAELSEERGRPLWRDKLAPIAGGTLYVDGNVAALVWKSAAETRATFVDLGQVAPSISSFVLDVAPPIWSRLVAGRLVAVWPGYVRVVQTDGQRTRIELDADVRARAASMDVYVGAEPLLVLSRSRSVCAYDLAAGARRWPLRIDETGSSDVTRAAMRVFEDDVLFYSRNTVRVYRATDGEVLAEFSPTGEVLTAAIVGETCWIVTADGESWKLHKLSLDDGANKLACTLKMSTGPQRFLWTPDRLVVIQSRRINAYALP